MKPLLTAAEMREADRYTTEKLEIPELVLMEHASLATVRSLQNRFGSLLNDTRGVIVAGPGNNGGDALAAARILHQTGCQNLFVCLVGDEHSFKPSGSTERQLRILSRLGIPFSWQITHELCAASDWILDGIFGTGLRRTVTGQALEVIQLLNQYSAKKWIVSLDIPSGLSADTGNPMGEAVKASTTVAFGFLKRGLTTGQAADYTGRVYLDEIQIPRIIPTIDYSVFSYGLEDARRIPARLPSSHKGSFGHAYLICGESEKSGATVLSALGALRSGVGLVSVITDDAERSGLVGRLPIEVMIKSWKTFHDSLTSETTVSIGPGLGHTENDLKRLTSLIESEARLVLDADAINLISQHKKQLNPLLKKRKAITVLTPHPKEASRLTGQSVDEIQADRFEAIRRLCELTGQFVLLKGKGTLIHGPERPIIVVSEGNTGLSKGGTGDVLTGLIVSLLAQQLTPEQALPLAAFIHGLASVRMSESWGHERASTAADLTIQFSRVFQEIDPWNERLRP